MREDVWGGGSSGLAAESWSVSDGKLALPQRLVVELGPEPHPRAEQSSEQTLVVVVVVVVILLLLIRHPSIRKLLLLCISRSLRIPLLLLLLVLLIRILLLLILRVERILLLIELLIDEITLLLLERFIVVNRNFFHFGVRIRLAVVPRVVRIVAIVFT